jgi:hypothetical protein
MGFGKNSTEKKCHFQYYMPRICTTHLTCPEDVGLHYLAKVELSLIVTLNLLCFFSPPHPILESLEEIRYVQPTLKLCANIYIFMLTFD